MPPGIPSEPKLSGLAPSGSAGGVPFIPPGGILPGCIPCAVLLPDASPAAPDGICPKGEEVLPPALSLPPPSLEAAASESSESIVFKNASMSNFSPLPLPPPILWLSGFYSSP